MNGADSNSIFLHIQSDHKRDTLVALVYGKSQPSIGASNLQWRHYSDDLDDIKRRFEKPYDTIFMGDINARLCRPMSTDEKKNLGPYGEVRIHEKTKKIFRDKNGSRALKFLVEYDLICLNDRVQQGSPHFTFHMVGKTSKKSIIDIICVSRSMMRDSYRTTVLPITITGEEGHSPVIADIRLHRRLTIPLKYTQTTQRWNLRKLKCENVKENFISLRDHLQTICIN